MSSRLLLLALLLGCTAPLPPAPVRDDDRAVESISWVGLEGAAEPFRPGDAVRFTVHLVPDSLGAEAGASLTLSWPGVFSDLACAEDGGGIYHADHLITVTSDQPGSELRLTGMDGAGQALGAVVQAPEFVSYAYEGGMVLVSAGTFSMGSPVTEPDRQSDEQPHQVTLSRDVLLGETEVTTTQYRSVALWAVAQGYATLSGDLLSAFGESLATLPDTGEDLPMTEVSWYGAACYLDWLSLMEDLVPFYNGDWDGSASHDPYLHDGYRLPTEAEWEYACRAGSTGRWCMGEDEARLGDYAWFYVNSGGEVHPVGRKLPNAWGLFDLHGNVWEWCQDWYGNYPAGAVTDPLGAASGSLRVYRGGSWYGTAWSCRSANRYYDAPSFRNINLGFRVARTLP